MITSNQAKLIIEAHDIEMAMEGEEAELLDEHNPELLSAYKALIEIANG